MPPKRTKKPRATEPIKRHHSDEEDSDEETYKRPIKKRDKELKADPRAEAVARVSEAAAATLEAMDAVDTIIDGRTKHIYSILDQAAIPGEKVDMIKAFTGRTKTVEQLDTDIFQKDVHADFLSALKSANDYFTKRPLMVEKATRDVREHLAEKKKKAESNVSDVEASRDMIRGVRRAMRGAVGQSVRQR